MNAERRGDVQQISGGGLRVRGTQGTHDLTPVLAAVWRAADGKTPVEGLVVAAQGADSTADLPLVWQALDTLADAGLLKARVAPPGAVVDRRALLRGVAAAAAAVVGVAVTARTGRAAEPAEQGQKARPQEQEDKLRVREQDEKRLQPLKEEAKKIRARESERKDVARAESRTKGGEAAVAEQRHKDGELRQLASEEAAKGI